MLPSTPITLGGEPPFKPRESGKADALIDRVRATHGRVIILPSDGEACSPDESLNGCSLTFVGVLVRPNIGKRLRFANKQPQTSVSFSFIPY